MRIGIPRGLGFFDFKELWITFFKELGQEVILSDNTNKTILNNGVNSCVDDACLPVKVFHGHVKDLLDKKVDYVFVPRLLSIAKKEYICPKFCGLPDMVKSAFKLSDSMLSPVVNLSRSGFSLREAVFETGLVFTSNRFKIIRAYNYALNKQKKYKEELAKGFLPDGRKINNGIYKYRVGLIAHPYLLYDDYLNLNIVEKLNKAGISLVLPDMVPEALIEFEAGKLDKRMFWSCGKKLLCYSMCLSKRKEVDGFIYLMSFGCGIDAFIEEIVRRRNRRISDIPLMALNLDEHTGEAGFNTRLEAFIDMIKRKGDTRDGSYVSAYGEYIYNS